MEVLHRLAISESLIDATSREWCFGTLRSDSTLLLQNRHITHQNQTSPTPASLLASIDANRYPQMGLMRWSAAG